MSQSGFGDEIKFPKFQIPKIASGAMRGIILGVLALVLALSSFYTIGPEEIGVVLRLGKLARTTEPGLHMKMPFLIERVIKVPVQRQLKEEFGFKTVSGSGRSQYSVRGREAEANMLTGDLNAAVVEWVVQYRIVDPYKFLFRVRNVRETFRAMNEAVMRSVIGDRTVNEVLTVGRQEIADLVEQNLQALCDQYETGIKVEQVVLQDVNPPDAVKPSFNEVNQAQQEREKLINQAQSEYNKVIPRARGEALGAVSQARGYALERTNIARGDSARFVAIYNEYRKAPEVTRKRIYLETMGQVLPQVDKLIIVDDALRSVLPLLNLDVGTKAGDGS